MIIDWPAEESGTEKLSHHITHPPLARCTTSTPLPPYVSSESLVVKPPSRPQKRRFFCCSVRTVVYCLIAYFVLLIVIGVPILVTKLQNAARATSSNVNSTGVSQNYVSPSVAAIPELPYSSSYNCNDWTYLDRLDAGTLHSSLQYQIALTDPPVSLFVRANLTDAVLNGSSPYAGSLHVGMNDDHNISDVIVSVNMSYSNYDIRKRTHVCLLHASPPHDFSQYSGLYIYVPGNMAHDDMLMINVDVMLPFDLPDSSAFTTKLAHFVQEFGTLPRFRDVLIGGSQSPITVDLLTAQYASLQTDYASIQGNFNISRSLIIDTTDAPIDVNVSLYYLGNSSDNGTSATYLSLSTGNASINANVSLVALATIKNSPNFDTDLSSTDEAITANFIVEPASVAAVMNVNANNWRAPCNVRYDDNLRGQYTVYSRQDTATSETEE